MSDNGHKQDQSPVEPELDAAPTDGDDQDSAEDEKPSKRKRKWRLTTALTILGFFAGAIMFGGGSPVGHFASAEGHDAFMRSYDRAMEDLPKPSKTLDVHTDFGSVRMYRFDGDNPDATPLVLVPGRVSASPVWADNVPMLMRDRPVYTIDMLGEAGKSIQKRPIENEVDQAAWLDQALGQLPGEKVHLFGLSFGGWTAMNLTARKPDHIASLTVLDPVVTFADLSFSAVVRSIPASSSWFPRSWRDSFSSWTANDAPVEDVPVADMIESGMQHYSQQLPQPSRFSKEQLEDVNVPVLVIMAGESRMHDSHEAARFAKQTMPEATVRKYRDASHAINGEYPEEIAADLDKFAKTAE